MKRLEPITIKRYTINQLIKHLDRVLTYVYEKDGYSLYRVDVSHNAIYTIDTTQRFNTEYYTFTICEQNREDIIEAIDTCYRALGL